MLKVPETLSCDNNGSTSHKKEINCPYSNDANLFVDIIFTIPVDIEMRKTEKFTFPQQPLLNQANQGQNYALFRVHMHDIR